MNKKISMKYIVALTCMFLFHLNLFAQNGENDKQIKIDSLKEVISTTTLNDTNGLNARVEYGLETWLFRIGYWDSIVSDCELILDEDNSNKIDKAVLNCLGSSYGSLGFIYSNMGEVDKAESYYQDRLKISKQLGDIKNIAQTYNSLAMILNDRGEVEKAIELWDNSLKMFSQIGDEAGKAYCFINIGSVHRGLEDNEKALEFFQKGLPILEKIDDKRGLSYALNNIGTTYMDMNEWEKALTYHERSLGIREELGDKKGIAMSTVNIGSVYLEFGDSEKALTFYERGLALYTEMDDKEGVSQSLRNIGGLYSLEGELEKANEYIEKALGLAQEIGSIDLIMGSASKLSEVYEKQKNGIGALEMYKLYVLMRDSINNVDAQKIAAKQQVKYEYEVKSIADSTLMAETKKVSDAQIATQQAQIEQEKTQRYALYGGVGLLLVFGGFMFNRFRITRKQKSIIELQKTEVEGQKLIVEERNKEVLDSINYAKRIQDALLKSEEHESKHLPPHYIYFQPKDIVSGDFYWALEKENYIYLAVADCTGHGVPGAFLTMLGTSFLNEINAHDKLLSPAEILDQLRNRFIKELSQTGADGESKDGMDISLIRLDLSTKELQWAGANNPLYLITKINSDLKGISEDRTRIEKDGKMISALLPDKEPIGYNYSMTPFTNHSVQLEEGDYICIFSDGYADQFGGIRGKKLKYKPFKELLLNICEKDMEDQKNILSSSFEKWKGDLEQIDDVCIIGVRV